MNFSNTIKLTSCIFCIYLILIICWAYAIAYELTDDNKDKKRRTPSQGDSSQGPEVTSAIGATTNVGDKHKKILDTGDISRASIAKGIRGPDDGDVTAADIAIGRTKPENIISYTTGISAETGKVLNPKTQASITKDLDKDIRTTNTEGVSKLVRSGTSSTKSAGIDKADIYSSDDSSRHLEKIQETTPPITKKVENKEDTTVSES